MIRCCSWWDELHSPAGQGLALIILLNGWYFALFCSHNSGLSKFNDESHLSSFTAIEVDRYFIWDLKGNCLQRIVCDLPYIVYFLVGCTAWDWAFYSNMFLRSIRHYTGLGISPQQYFQIESDWDSKHQTHLAVGQCMNEWCSLLDWEAPHNNVMIDRKWLRRHGS